MERTPYDLIDRILDGEASSFADLLDWYSADVHRLAYLILGGNDEAGDIVQETFLLFIRRVKEHKFYSRNGSIKGFLLICARNLCIDRLRKRKRHQSAVHHTLTPKTEWAEMKTPRQAVDEKRLYDAFDHALKKIPDEQRIVFVLFELNGESYQEIADALNLSTDQVRMRLHRARITLRKLLESFRSG